MGLTRYNYQTRDIPDMVGHRTHEDIIDKWWLMMATVGSAEQFGCISRGHRQQHIVIGTMISYWCLAGNEGMIPVITSNNHPSNPQQPIHSLRLAPVRFCIAMLQGWYIIGKL